MKRKTILQALTLASLTCTIFSCKAPTDQKKESNDTIADTAWAMLPFIKVDTVNPVLTPGNNSFHCPILGKEIKWEEKDVFNPAAVVRDDKVYLLYRAED